MGEQHNRREQGAPVPLAVKTRTHRTKENTIGSKCNLNRNNGNNKVTPPLHT